MKIFQLLVIIIFVFFLNIGLYYSSNYYRNFLKNFKGNDIVNNNNNNNINDEYKIKKEDIEKNLEDELNEKIFRDNKKLNQELKSKKNLIEKIKFVKKQKIEKIVISDYFENLLEKFKNYNFTKLENSSTLMEITSEYPDKYFEYYSPELTLYYFPTKKYDEVKEIFELVSDGKLFIINEVDNFGEESFYINLGEDYKDDFIRIIFVKNNNVIGIKVSKNEYNSIKNIIK